VGTRVLDLAAARQGPPEALGLATGRDVDYAAAFPFALSGDVARSQGLTNDLAKDSVEAVLDCTGGWFSRQQWSGIRLDRLLESAGTLPAGTRSLEVVSSTGFSRRFPVDRLDRVWLATAVGGRPLSPGHGFPVRIVAPDRRGFWWVKWVVAVRADARPWWTQPPFPLTAKFNKVTIKIDRPQLPPEEIKKLEEALKPAADAK